MYFLFYNREFAYSLRVRLLEAVDNQKHQAYFNPRTSAIHPDNTESSVGSSANNKKLSSAPPSTASASSTMEEWEETMEDNEENSNNTNDSGRTAAEDSNTSNNGDMEKGSSQDCGHCVDDLGR